MGKDPIYDHLTKLVGGHYECNLCGTKFRGGKSRPIRLKFHLTKLGDNYIPACVASTAEVRRIAKDLTKVYAVRAINDDARPVDPPPAPQQADPIFQRLFGCIHLIVSNLHFVPTIGSMVFYYAQGIAQMVNPPIPPEPPFYGGNAFISKEVRALIAGYKHTLAILQMHGDHEDILVHSQAVDEIADTRYTQLVEYLIARPDFWLDARTFELHVTPLMEIVATLAEFGPSIGHVRLACDHARFKYTTVDFSPQVGEILTALWDEVLTLPYEAAKYFDPGFMQFLIDEDRPTIHAREVLEQFGYTYVLDTELAAYEQGLDLYLALSDVIFNNAADLLASELHPAKFWAYSAGGVLVFRKYAMKAVCLKYGDLPLSEEELRARFADNVDISEATIDEAGRGYSYITGFADVDDSPLARAFLAQHQSYVGGFKEFSAKLQSFSTTGWGYMVYDKYLMLIATLGGHLG